MRILSLFLLILGPLAADPALTSETIFDWRTPSSPQISPDGRRVVYMLETADRFADTFHSNLWIVTTDAKDHRQLTSGKWKDSLPRWSPDGGEAGIRFDSRGEAADIRSLDGHRNRGEDYGSGECADCVELVTGWRDAGVFGVGASEAGVVNYDAESAGWRELGGRASGGNAAEMARRWDWRDWAASIRLCAFVCYPGHWGCAPADNPKNGS